MQAKFRQLKTLLLEVNDLTSTIAVLRWDQSTHMPPEGATARARQVATLSRLSHEKFTSPEVGKLLDALQTYGESLPYDSFAASLLRVTRRDYERAIKIPAEFKVKVANHGAECYQAWTEARPANDFVRMRPYLEKTLEYRRQTAEFFSGYDHIADPLIESSDYGVKTADLKRIFADLRSELVPLVTAITAQTPTDDTCLRQHFPEDKQLAFGLDVAQKLGYNLNRGRQDKTHHPFATKFSHGDVRITTRAQANFFSEALFSTVHEAGHAMYEMGIHEDLEGTPLGHGTSAGVHESQSRLWENIVGRSREFWQHFYPQLQGVFPEQLASVPLETFYRAINKVERSLIRTDADEITYNLHIMLRFDLELALLEGELEIVDLPDAWRARFETDFGILPPDDKDGVLQDVHWYYGYIGGLFQAYTLGNILSAQFFATALRAHPEISAQIAGGEFTTLHSWLKENLYQHGSKFTASELTQRATGDTLTIAPYLAYLRKKFGELYELPSS